MTREKEHAIIEQVLHGDVNAFETIVLENQKTVYNLALKMLGNPDDAMDISQETFLRAFKSLGSFRGDSRLSVWLYRLTYNLCIDFLRKAKRRDETSLSSLYAAESDESEPEIPDIRCLPEDELVRGELRTAVRESFSALPDSDRQILSLREIGGFSYDEIAASLNTEIGTVKSRLFRARKRLCAILQKNGNFTEETPSKHNEGGVTP